MVNGTTVDGTAGRMADGLGLAMDTVSPLPPDPPVDVRDAVIVVAIGPDLANP